MEAIYLGCKSGTAKKTGEPYNMFFFAAAGNRVEGLEACTAFMPSTWKSVFKPMQKVNVEFGPNNRVVGVTNI